MKRFCCLFLVFSVFAVCHAGDAYVKNEGPNWIIGNDYIERTIAADGDGLRTVRIVNKLEGKTYEVESDGFTVTIEANEKQSKLAAKDFSIKSVQESGPGRLRAEVVEDGCPVMVTVHYSVAPDEFYIRKQLRIEAVAGDPLVRDVEVESLKIGKLEWQYIGGRGKPAFVGPFFLGLEHPAGWSTGDKARLILRHYPGRKPGKGGMSSYVSVIGCARSADELKGQFFEYVNRIRYDYPKPLRHHIVAKLFYVGRKFNDAEYCAFAEEFKKNLFDKYGLYFDSLNIWNYYLRGPGIFIMDEKKYPNGFAPVVEALKPTGARVGFWFSLFCHEHCDTRWGYDRGYEVQGDPGSDWLGSRYCLAGPNYNKALREVFLGRVEKYRPGFMHLDFNSFGCKTPGHGHLPDAKYGFEANVNAEIAVLEDVRKIVPDTFLMMGCGSYSSPWWLKYYDVVFGMASDSGLCGIPDPSPKGNEITKRDITFKRRFEVTDPAFPSWGYWTHEPLLNRGEFGARPVRLFKLDPLEKWEDNLVMDMHRGTRVWAMHYDPALLDSRPGNWDFLAHAIRYARRNNPIIVNMKLVGGQPRERQVYGYAHFSRDGGKVILALRNPFVKPQEIHIKLDGGIGLKQTQEELLIRQTYPYRFDYAEARRFGDDFSCKLERFELKVFEIAARSKLKGSFFPGKRYSLVGRWAVVEEAPEVVIRPGKFRAKLDGHALAGVASVEIEGCDAKLMILCEVDPALAKLPDVQASVNGKARQGKLIGYGPTAYRVKRPKPSFAWYIVPLDRGRNAVAFSIKFPERFHEAKLGAWVAADIALLAAANPMPVEGIEVESQLLSPAEWDGKELRTVELASETLEGDLPRMTATASSYATYNPTYVPKSVVDGNEGTFWVSVGTRNQWVELDLGEEAKIGGVTVTWYSPWKVQDYKIQTWDGTQWVDRVVKHDTNTDDDRAGPYKITDKFGPVRARKIRVVVISVDEGSGNTSIREIEPIRVK